MSNKFKKGIIGLSALLCVAGMFGACSGKAHDNTPDDGDKPAKQPPAIEYTVDETVLSGNKDANHSDFYVNKVERVEDSPLAGKTIYWLGSSVTYGACSGGESMADFLAAKTGAICKKDAVSGTTIFTDGKTENTGAESYTSRLKNSTEFNKNAIVDAFICQISTNDAWGDRAVNRGYVTDISVQDKDEFNLKTTMGGVEYIISYVTEIWDCPIYFYSGSYFGDTGTGNRTNGNPTGTGYKKMIDDVKVAVAKWQELGYEVDVIDLYNDEDFNNQVSDDYYKWCTNDPVHPKRAGYLNWWMPYFEQYLIVKFEN